tara:strand:+ start:26 stop:223 length:198 start_codon:yes stop_codon:yes gene_type:complete
MKVNQKQIKQIFKQEQVQLGKGSMELINFEMYMLARKMAKRCKEGNIKRLTPELFGFAVGIRQDV